MKASWKTIITYILFILLGISISSGFFIIKNNKNNKKEVDLLAKELIEKELIEKKIKFNKSIKTEITNKLNLKAESFFVADIDSEEIIFQKNPDKKLGIASLTKIATTAIALKNNTNNKKLQIKREFITYTSSYNNLIPNEIFDFNKALELMFITSSNDIALSVAYNNENRIENYNYFLEKMNKLADDLNMKSTIFFSPTGLDEKSNINGSYSSSSDIFKLVKFFYKNYPVFIQNVTVPKKEICSNIFCHKLENTNPLISTTPNIIFSKTG